LAVFEPLGFERAVALGTDAGVFVIDTSAES
jgi:hypothetical protein